MRKQKLPVQSVGCRVGTKDACVVATTNHKLQTVIGCARDIGSKREKTVMLKLTKLQCEKLGKFLLACAGYGGQVVYGVPVLPRMSSSLPLPAKGERGRDA